MQPALLQIQNDVTSKLEVELMDWGVAVRSQRRMIIANEVDEKLLVMSLTNGMTGAGCLVQMPKFQSERPDVPGPMGFILLKTTVFEMPETNMNASMGTRRSAEEIAIRILQLLHLWNMNNIGTLYSAPDAITAAASDPGVVAYDVGVRMQFCNEVLSKTGNPAITSTGGVVSIANASGFSGSSIYYTTDGESYPGPDLENSFLYAAPFTATVGGTIRAAAYKSGYTGSHILEHTVT